MTDIEDKREVPVASTRLRVATWNMDHWRRTPEQRRLAWQSIQSELRADIALLQECVAPPHHARGHVAYREIGGSRAFGTAVVSTLDGVDVQEIDTVRTRHGAHRFSMLGSTPGTIMVARASIPGLGPLTCVSIYGLINTYAQTTMLRVVADLIPLFDSPDGEHVVLGGDFNIDATKDDQSTDSKRYQAIIQAVKSLGLDDLAEKAQTRPTAFQNCPCRRPDCHHLNTYGAGNGVQLDYLFATPALAARCKTLEVVASPTLSDHRAIVAELDLSRLEARRYDPASFCTEVAARSGAAAGKAAEEIVGWAQRKHGAISTHRRVTLDRLPISSDADPQLWIQLDLSKTRIQWTVSIHASGTVEIQFQHMIAPFDTTERREQLWAALNDAAGNGLTKNLKGRPSFPLRVLAEPGRTERFLAVLESIVDETLAADTGAR